MQYKKFLFTAFVLTLIAGQAYAAPSVRSSGSNGMTVTEGVTDEILSQLKTVEQSKLKLVLKKIGNEDLARICSAFPQLTELKIEDSQELTSLVPVVSLSQLCKLEIDAKKVRDFTPLAGLTALESLAVSSSEMGPDLKWMSAMTRLKDIRIVGGEHLTSFEGLPALPSLKKIKIAGASPADLSPLLAMPELKEVDCTGCTSSST